MKKVIISQMIALDATRENLAILVNADVVERKNYNSPAEYVMQDTTPRIDVVNSKQIIDPNLDCDETGEYYKRELEKAEKEKKEQSRKLDEINAFASNINKARSMGIKDEELRGIIKAQSWLYNFDIKKLKKEGKK
jgi:hypothetical protein